MAVEWFRLQEWWMEYYDMSLNGIEIEHSNSHKMRKSLGCKMFES